MVSLVGYVHLEYLMPDAAVRIHHAEETFEGGLLENERSRKTSNHCSYYHYGVHFHVLRLNAEQSACQIEWREYWPGAKTLRAPSAVPHEHRCQ